MLLKLFALCLLFSLGSAEDIPTLSVPDLIRYWGYDFENHFVVTDDDYVLGVHRIKTSSGGEKSSKIPVFLQHGLFGSSARFTAGPPEKVQPFHFRKYFLYNFITRCSLLPIFCLILAMMSGLEILVETHIQRIVQLSIRRMTPTFGTLIGTWPLNMIFRP